MMNCPRCAEILRPAVPYSWLCPRCEGCWVDKGSLYHITRLTRSQLAQTPLQPTLVADPKNMRVEDRPMLCPECRRSLTRQIYCGDSGVEVDRCADHGMWFDDGELALVVDYLQGEQDW
jgi:Zn-finger nucleic acid-binding protein